MCVSEGWKLARAPEHWVKFRTVAQSSEDMDWESASTKLGEGREVALNVHKVLRGLDEPPGMVATGVTDQLQTAVLLIEKDSQVSSGSSEFRCSDGPVARAAVVRLWALIQAAHLGRTSRARSPV